jgi:predicted aspartyl protease
MSLEIIKKQRAYGILSIDNHEKDVVSLWCDEGEDPQVVMIERENLQIIIDKLTSCLNEK